MPASAANELAANSSSGALVLMAREAQSPSLGQVQINPWFIAIAVMLATFMEVLDTSIAAVAVPYIGGSLSASNNKPHGSSRVI